MNIALYMAVRDNAHDLSHMATSAVLAICARCPRNKDRVAVSIVTIAGDLRCHWDTAARALRDATRAGYLAVDKPANKWVPMAYQVLVAVSPRTQNPRTLVAVSTNTAHAQTANIKGLKDWRKEGAPSPARRKAASNGAVDKHPDSCRCAGTGWVAAADGTVTRCVLEAAK